MPCYFTVDALEALWRECSTLRSQCTAFQVRYVPYLFHKNALGKMPCTASAGAWACSCEV